MSMTKVTVSSEVQFFQLSRCSTLLFHSPEGAGEGLVKPQSPLWGFWQLVAAGRESVFLKRIDPVGLFVCVCVYNNNN